MQCKKILGYQKFHILYKVINHRRLNLTQIGVKIHTKSGASFLVIPVRFPDKTR